MSSDTLTRVHDKFVTVDGLRTRYIEEGEGSPVLLLHGASLGSSADVFIRNLGPLARAGLRVIAFDQPGFGLPMSPPIIRPPIAAISSQIHGCAGPLPRRPRGPFAGRQPRRAVRAQGAGPLFACDRGRNGELVATDRWRGRH